jgi:hypothetical protein
MGPFVSTPSSREQNSARAGLGWTLEAQLITPADRSGSSRTRRPAWAFHVKREARFDPRRMSWANSASGKFQDATRAVSAAHRGGTTRATETVVTVSTGLISKPTDLSSNEASAGSSELKRCHWDSSEDVDS